MSLLPGLHHPFRLSRPPQLNRQLVMRGKNAVRLWLAAVVVVHLVVSMLHGLAHQLAHVSLSTAGALFVLIVIFIGPLVGLGLMWRSLRIGGWIVATTMAASFVFGFVNHFVFASPDHVSAIVPEWQLLFATTASLLAFTEATGCFLALGAVRERKFLS
jgi:hypothetical protein